LPITRPALSSGDYSYTLETVLGMQATLGKLTEMMPGTPLKVSDPRIHRLRDSSLLSNRLV
jgi:hypothetical protein